MFWYFLNEAVFWLCKKKKPGKYSLSKPILRNNVLHITLELLTRMIICEDSQIHFPMTEEKFTF